MSTQIKTPSAQRREPLEQAWEKFRQEWNLEEVPVTHRDRVLFDGGWKAAERAQRMRDAEAGN